MRLYMQKIMLVCVLLCSVAYAATSASSQSVYQDAEHTYWFEEGNAQAPHAAYVLIEPNCWYCQQLYQRMQPLVARGQLRVRWIVAAFLQPSSEGKTAAVFQAADPNAMLQHDLEMGGIRGTKVISASSKTKIARNNRFVGKYELYTPAIVYRNLAHETKVAQGLLSDNALQALVEKMQQAF